MPDGRRLVHRRAAHTAVCPDQSEGRDRARGLTCAVPRLPLPGARASTRSAAVSAVSLIVAFADGRRAGHRRAFHCRLSGRRSRSVPARSFPTSGSRLPFKVSDHSSGSATDASSPVAFAGDGRAMTTSAWPASFATDHYVELRFNDPLPGNVALSAASFDLSWASASGHGVHLFRCCATRAADCSMPKATRARPCRARRAPVQSTSSRHCRASASTDDANGATRAHVRVELARRRQRSWIRPCSRSPTDAEQFTLYPVDVIDAADGTPSTRPLGPGRAVSGPSGRWPPINGRLLVAIWLGCAALAAPFAVGAVNNDQPADRPLHRWHSRLIRSESITPTAVRPTTKPRKHLRPPTRRLLTRRPRPRRLPPEPTRAYRGGAYPGGHAGTLR